jgi:sporulation protein YlmC with PRC-barrel domain
MTSQIPRTVLTVLALVALAGYVPAVRDSALATSSGSSPQSSRSEDASRERTAIHALGQARYGAQNRRPQQVLEQIERAETAMLNISQIARDPHVDTALQHMAAARAAVGRKNLRDAEAELAAATSDLTVTLALLAPDDVLVVKPIPMIGEVVYDADADKVGDVTEIIFDPRGDVAQVVIGVGDSLGAGKKNVAVPPGQVAMADKRLIVGMTKEQLRQSKNYQLPDYGS